MKTERLEKYLYGTTKVEAQRLNVCLRCKEYVDEHIYTEAGKSEYRISGICEDCFDYMFKDNE